MNYKKLGNWIFLIAVVFTLEMIMFRNVIFSTKLIGDFGDARLNTLLMEHWYKFFQGKAPFHDLPIFFPMKNTISYTDLLLGYSLPYSFFRFIGNNIYDSAKYTCILFHFVGSYFTILLLKKRFNFNNIAVIIGLIMISYSNNFFVRTGHTQFFTFGLIAPMIYFIYSYFVCIQSNNKRFVYASIGITLFFTCLYSSYYTGYFILLFSLTFIIIFIVFDYLTDNYYNKIIIKYILENKREISIYVMLFICLMIPFLKIYLPTSLWFGRRAYGETLDMLPQLIDYINVSPNNLFYGRIIENLKLDAGELSIGFPFITFFCIIYSLFFIINNKKKIQNRIILILVLNIIFSAILILKIKNHSMWWFVYTLFPGASSLRAVARYMTFLSIPIGIVLSYVTNILLLNKSLRRTIIGIIVCSIIFFENLTKFGVSCSWDSKQAIAKIAEIPAPPKECKYMFIYNDRTPPYAAQLDAWEIANKFNIKTFNGYSGIFPKKWKLRDVNSSNYFDNIYNWIQYNNIENDDIYGYDQEKRQWIKFGAHR